MTAGRPGTLLTFWKPKKVYGEKAKRKKYVLCGRQYVRLQAYLRLFIHPIYIFSINSFFGDIAMASFRVVSPSSTAEKTEQAKAGASPISEARPGLRAASERLGRPPRDAKDPLEFDTLSPGAAGAQAPANNPAPAAETDMLGSIDTIASAWSGQSQTGEGRKSTNVVPTPEELISAAEARGLDVTFAERDLKSLVEKDFPCVIFSRDGQSTILLGWDGKQLRCNRGGELFRALPEDLIVVSTGVVFFVRPHADNHVLDPSAPVEYAEKKDKGLVATVVSEMYRKQRSNVILLATAAAGSNLLLFAIPLFSMTVYDRVIPHLATETLWALALGVTLALSVDYGLRSARLKLNDAVALTVCSTLQSRFFARILRARSGEVTTLGGSLQAGLREIENVCQLVPGLLVSIVVDLPFFILATLLLYIIAGPVAFVPWAACIIALSLQLLVDFRDKKVRESSRLSMTQSNLLVETAAAREMVQTLGVAAPLLRRWERLTDAAAFAGHLNRLSSSLASIAALTIGQAAVVVTIVVGVYQIGAGAMTIGALTAATLLIGRMMTPMTQLGTYLHRLKQVAASTAVVEKILDAKQEGASDPTSPRREISGLVEFKDVVFSYPDEQAPALQGINLTIRPGERIGLIGRAGSGKSTLLKLIIRLYDPAGGSYRLDGFDSRQFAPEHIRRHFGYMRQDAVLFDDTLRNAICFGMDHVDENVFNRAIAISGVKDFASRHPSGFGLRVGPRGERLSGGERQAVMLARVLMAEPKAFIMDEPTASMDNTLEMQLVRDLREHIAGRTFVIATHRAALLGLVDRLIWLENGKIVADGPKNEVLARMAAS
jgi:ATP-binding cassette subfamily C protein LapB